MGNVDHISKFINAMNTRRNLSIRTLKAYKSDLRGFKRFLGENQLVSVHTTEIQAFVAQLEIQGLCASSIRRKLATIKVFFGFLQAEGIIDHEPLWKSSERYRVPKKLPRVLAKQDIIKILSVAHARAIAAQRESPTRLYTAVRNLLVIELLFSLGIRIDELTRLDVEDIDPRNGSVVVFGKGRKERLLYLSSKEVRRLINEYLPLRDNVALVPHAFLVNRSGKRLGNSSIGRIFASLSSEAGVHRHYTPHCLRHTMATMLIENGADVRSVQEILGHSSICTTEIYLHVSKKRKKEVLGRFNERNNICLLKT